MRRKSDIFLFTVFFVHLVFCGVFVYSSYKAGRSVTQSDLYLAVRFYLLMCSLFVSLACLIAYVFSMFFRIGLKSTILPIALSMTCVVSLVYSLRLSITLPAKGYYKYVKANVNIDEIHRWLTNYDKIEYENVNADGIKRAMVFNIEWPDCIKSLHPTRGVWICESNSKKYLEVCYALDWEMSFGLCVMEESIEVPEYRGAESLLKLQDNAFVWVSF